MDENTTLYEGDRIVIRSDLTDGRFYPETNGSCLVATTYMERLREKEAVVSKVVYGWDDPEDNSSSSPRRYFLESDSGEELPGFWCPAMFAGYADYRTEDSADLADPACNDDLTAFLGL